MSETSAVRPHLERHFKTHRVVFWHDPEGDYSADLDTLRLEGVETVRVANNEYAIKNRLLHLEPEAKFLVYRSGAVPTGIGNWLLDLELAYGVFTADRTALVLQELGLTANAVGDVVQAHEKFFRATRRVQSIKALLDADDDADKLRARRARYCSVSESTACWRSPAPCSSRTPPVPTRSTAPSPTTASTSSTGRAPVRSTATRRRARASTTSCCGCSGRLSPGSSPNDPVDSATSSSTSPVCAMIGAARRR